MKNLDKLSTKIEESLKYAQQHALRMQMTSRWLLIGGVLASAATTLVTGLTAAQGPIVGEGPEGWQISCIIAAILGFITTICIALNQQLNVGERLSKANECTGRLKSLDISIMTGNRRFDEIASEYESIVRDYPEAIRRT